MNWFSFKDEIVTLSSIYCAHEELMISNNGKILSTDELVNQEQPLYPIKVEIKINIPSSSNNISVITLTVVIIVTTTYPQESPEISLQSDILKDEFLKELHVKTLEYVSTLIPEQCLFQIVEYIKQLITDAVLTNLKIFKSPSTSSEHQKNKAASLSDSPCHNYISYLITIDHMRNESRYCKMLEKWSKELNVSCTVINCGLHNLYVQLVGDTSDVGQFLKVWKSQNVDVNSRGHPCKERLLSIVNQVMVTHSNSIGYV